MYMIKEASNMSGVSVRTLHHYDEIGLLSPNKADNSYRYYSDQDMARLQTILFYKYLGFPLKTIQQLLASPDSNILSHLKRQLVLVEEEQEKLLTLINTLRKTIASEERRITMTTQEKFQGFVYQDNPKYRQAASDKYGKAVVEAAIAKQRGKEQELTDGFNRIFFAFAANHSAGIAATATENIALAEQLHSHIRQYAFDCPRDVFGHIGQGYVDNPDFQQNIDQFGIDTAQYVCDAIQAYIS